MIVLVSGRAENGKDTFTRLARAYLLDKGIRTAQFAYGDAVKQAAKDIGWNGEKDERGRKILQLVGTEIGRELIDENIWVKKVINIIATHPRGPRVFFITDCRFPNEINFMNAFFKDEEEVVTIRVHRPNHESALTEEQRNHPSETALKYWEFDKVIHNNKGLDELNAMVKEFADEIILSL